jgi:hypothetical protein
MAAPRRIEQPEPVVLRHALSAVAHHGTAERAFSMAYHGSLLTFRANQPVTADTLLHRAMDSASAPVTWRM